MTTGQLLVTGLLFAVALVGIPAAAVAWWAGRRALRRALDPRRLPPVQLERNVYALPEQLPRAGWLPYDFDWRTWANERRDFPADTGPLILMSEQAAAIIAHEREVNDLIRQAEERYGRLQ